MAKKKTKKDIDTTYEEVTMKALTHIVSTQAEVGANIVGRCQAIDEKLDNLEVMLKDWKKANKKFIKKLEERPIYEK